VRYDDDTLSRQRDLRTLKSRVEQEGLSFLTITLPQLADDFDNSLAAGHIVPQAFRSFKKIGKARLIPAFLGGIIAQVFDKERGSIHDEPDLASIEAVRMLGRCFKKIKLPCTPIRERKAIAKFVTDESVFEETPAPDAIADFLAVARNLWSRILHDLPDVRDAWPKHGPGATAERITGNGKYVHKRWHDRLEPYFPLLDYAYVSTAYDSPEVQRVKVVSEEEEHPVRIHLVPKTLKTPRIIAIEPVCMQYAQQALSSMLIEKLEDDPVTSGHINFSDQGINRDLALRASADMSMATIDMSSASDRVPRDLALNMFNSAPDFQAALDACRSRMAMLPDGRIIDLKKFASMGSATCFPVEAMYFYTICVLALIREAGLPITTDTVKLCASRVYVYGDDILVPTGSAPLVVDTLHEYYCKVNTQKSYWTGRFRESCGLDAYDGEPVTPVYIRSIAPNNRKQVSEIVSWVETSNLLYLRGYWKSAEFMISRVEKILGTDLPIIGPDAPCLGKLSFQGRLSVGRWSKTLHRPEVKGWVVQPIYVRDEIDSYAALTKSLLKLESGRSSEYGINHTSAGRQSLSEIRKGFPISISYRSTIEKYLIKGEAEIAAAATPSDLEYVPRRGGVTLKSRWITPF
jgi:hypothetical protein